MDTQTFWTTVVLISTALMIITPLAHRALGGDPRQRPVLRAAGVLAALSFTIDPGVGAAVLTLPWLSVGVVLTWAELRALGCAALLHRPSAVVLGPLAAWLWMAAGAAWLTAHRFGLQPFGFDRSITLLTVAHFHVAGLAVTALLAVTFRRRPRRTLTAAAWLHQAGMLHVAAGLTFNDHLEVAGATMITLALAVWAVAVVGWMIDELHGWPRILLGIATVAWVLPMALALGWALGPFLPEPIVTTFATMLRFHAALQTFGLAVCGLAGVLLAGAAANPTADTQHSHTTRTEAHHDVAHQAHG